mgnify:FL=1
MFVVISLMFSGILIGYVFRNNNLKFINKIITVLIWSLLFLLGIEVGGNQEIIEGLHTIGIEALIITVAAVLGSVVGALILWKWIKKRNNKEAI